MYSPQWHISPSGNAIKLWHLTLAGRGLRSSCQGKWTEKDLTKYTNTHRK